MGDPTPAHPRRGGVGTHLLVLLGYAALAAALFAPALADPANKLIGQGGPDSVEKTWFLAWLPHAVTTGQPLLHTAAINTPDGINMMWNTSTLFLGAVLSPVTALFGPVVAFNAGMYLAVVLSAWCGYWCINRIVGSRWGAIAGGLLYGFSPYMMGQALGHLTLLTMVFPPIALVLMYEIVVVQRRRWWLLGLLLGVAAAAQVFVSEEVLTSTAIAIACGAVVLALFHRDQVRQRLPYILRAALLGAAVAAILAGWAVWYQFRGPDQVHQAVQGLGAFVTDPLGFFIPTANQAIAPSPAVAISQHFRGNLSEWNAYLGLPLIGVIAWSVWRWWSVMFVKVITVSAVVIAILSLGPYVVLRGHQFPIPLPWYVVQHIPGLDQLLPSRLMAYVYLLTGMLVAYAISQLSPATMAARLRVAAVAALTVLFLMPALPRPTADTPVGAAIPPDVAQELRAGGVVLPSPYATQDDADSMLVQARADFAFAMPGGYAYAPNLPPVAPPTELAVLDDPASGEQRSTALATPAGRAHALALLQQAHVQTIVVLAGPYAADLRTFWGSLLGVAPKDSHGFALWTDVPRDIASSG